MIRTQVGKAAFLLIAAALGSGAAIVGCSKHSGPSEDLGAVTVALTLSPGVTINTVRYAITGNAITPINGSIDVTNATHATALVSGVAPGTGYLLTMDATSVDGQTTCHGTTTFNVTAGQTATANVVLQCKGPNGRTTGTVAINGRLDNCPFITGYSATSLETTVGSSINVGATVTEFDAGDTVTFSWTAAPAGIGTIGAASGSTTFTCTALGSTTLSLAVSDGVCGDSLSNIIPINCVSGPVVGTGGTGTGGSGTGGSGTGGMGTGGSGVGGNGTGGMGTGGMGTGGMGTGGMGTGGMVACIEPASGTLAACCDCTTTNCSLDPSPSGTDGCSGLPTAAAQALCRAAATCFAAAAHPTNTVIPGHCTVTGDATRCFCGNSGGACFSTAGAANGPCTAEVIAAAGSSDPPTIRSVFTSSASPLGRAVNLLGCQGAICATECSVP